RSRARRPSPALQQLLVESERRLRDARDDGLEAVTAADRDEDDTAPAQVEPEPLAHEPLRVVVPAPGGLCELNGAPEVVELVPIAAPTHAYPHRLVRCV